MEEKYGKMIISSGLKHDYFGMDLNYNNTGEVKIDVMPYTSKKIEYLPE